MKIPHAVAANTAWGIFYIMCKTSTCSNSPFVNHAGMLTHLRSLYHEAMLHDRDLHELRSAVLLYHVQNQHMIVIYTCFTRLSYYFIELLLLFINRIRDSLSHKYRNHIDRCRYCHIISALVYLFRVGIRPFCTCWEIYPALCRTCLHDRCH